MDYFFQFDALNLGWSIVYNNGPQFIICIKLCFFFTEDFFVLASSVDPDEMQHDA